MAGLHSRLPLKLQSSLYNTLQILDFRQDRYRGHVSRTAHRLTEAAVRREISAEQLLDEIEVTFSETDMAAEFAECVEVWRSDRKTERWLCRRIPRRFLGSLRARSRRQDLKMGLQLFYLNPHSSEPPHYHAMIASLQCVIRGHIYCRQYDRVARAADNVVMIRPTSQKKLMAGDTFRMTDHKDNVHWFGTEDEPAVVLDFFIEGPTLYDRPFDSTPGQSPGRHYLDPTGQPDAQNLIAARELRRKEAYKKFASKGPMEF